MPVTSEAHFLQIVDKYFPNQHPSLALGRGDDCAILRTQGKICVSTDLFLEDVHFRRSYFEAQDVGHKALAVNISDIAAMGAKPMGFSLGVGLPETISEQWLDGFFSGLSSLAKKFDMILVGGDVTSSPFVHISITIWGVAAKSLLKSHEEEQRKFLKRGGAMPGDTLFMVGSLGLARLGLQVLEKDGISAIEQWPTAVAAHLRPAPLVNAGLIIARLGAQARPSVLMDVSDGLASDLPRLLGMHGQEQSLAHLGAQVILPEALLHEEVIRYNREHGLCPSTEAWLGGEDYALLGACVPKLFPILRAALPMAKSIGVITDDGKITLNGAEVSQNAGYDHFGHSLGR